MYAGTPPEPKNGAAKASASSFVNMIRSFDERTEADRPFVPMVGGPRLFVLLLYASVLVAVGIEFFASTRLWYSGWSIYNAYVLIVTGVFVFFGMVMLFSSTRRGPDEYGLPVPRLLLATLGFVLLSLSGVAMVYWGKSLDAWAILLSITLLYGFLMMVLASETITDHDGLRLIMYGTGVVLMVLVPVHEAFNVARTPPSQFFLFTLLNLVLLISGMVFALISVQSLQTRDGYLGAWLIGAMAIFLVAFHEQFGIVVSGTYSEYDRTLAFIGVTFSFLPLMLYVWRERVYIFLWRNMRSANSLIASGDYKSALKQADGAIRQCARVGIEDRFALPWTLKSDALYRMKDYQKAMVHYDTALSIEPNDSVSWCHMGNMYAFEGKQQQALEAFDHAIKVDPENPYAWNNKGAVYQQMGKDEDALICFDKAILYEPRMFDAHLNMAKLFSKLGHTTDALEHYRIALDINPGSESAMQGMRREYFRSMCLDQINGWEQLGLDASYLRTLLDQDPTGFVKKSKEFLANIVDQRAEFSVHPGMEHIDMNKAIKTILQVTEGEGATVDQILEATNLKRSELILPLALLMETDHMHFKGIGGTEVYVSKGKAPEKPSEVPIHPIETVVVEPVEQPIPTRPIAVTGASSAKMKVDKVGIKAGEKAGKTEIKAVKKVEKAEKAEKKVEKKVEKATAKSSPKSQPRTSPSEQVQIRREIVKVEPTASILFFRRHPKKR
jgi:tetratricopeptide (TPR) repeat protein